MKSQKKIVFHLLLIVASSVFAEDLLSPSDVYNEISRNLRQFYWNLERSETMNKIDFDALESQLREDLRQIESNEGNVSNDLQDRFAQNQWLYRYAHEQRDIELLRALITAKFVNDGAKIHALYSITESEHSLVKEIESLAMQSGNPKVQSAAMTALINSGNAETLKVIYSSLSSDLRTVNGVVLNEGSNLDQALTGVSGALSIQKSLAEASSFDEKIIILKDALPYQGMGTRMMHAFDPMSVAFQKGIKRLAEDFPIKTAEFYREKIENLTEQGRQGRALGFLLQMHDVGLPLTDQELGKLNRYFDLSIEKDDVAKVAFGRSEAIKEDQPATSKEPELLTVLDEGIKQPVNSPTREERKPEQPISVVKVESMPDITQEPTTNNTLYILLGIITLCGLSFLALRKRK